jgi:SNF2 family DNA or RNA helicase
MAILHGSWIGGEEPVGGQESSQTQERPLFFGAPPRLFLWGEIWRSVEGKLPFNGKSTRKSAKTPESFPLHPHPYGLTPAELMDFLAPKVDSGEVPMTAALLAAIAQSSSASVSSTPKAARRSKATPAEAKSNRLPDVPGWSTQTLALPTVMGSGDYSPIHSAVPLGELPLAEAEALVLQPLTVTGIAIPLTQAMPILQALPLSPVPTVDQFMGDDLRYWTHVARWCLDLMARGKLVPTLIPDQAVLGQWVPLLDSALDRDRFQKFAARMPRICQSFSPTAEATGPSLALPTKTGQTLLRVLQAMMDTLVRPCLEPELLQAVQKAALAPMAKQWVQHLGAPSTALGDRTPKSTQVKAVDVADFAGILHQWLAPIQAILRQDLAFRPCFLLDPPLPGRQDWQLSYYLQSAEDPNVMVSAEQIWNTTEPQLHCLGRTLDQPQETLLTGLGLASRVYPLLEESLQGARPVSHRLTPLQAYDFLRATAWRLEDSGFGVILPPSLANREGWANRLGLQIRAQAPTGGGLGLESLLNFKWELAIGGQTLSRAEFERLVALNSPLVEVNGEWVELRAQDVKAAQTFFANRNQQTGLSLQDALRIQSGDTLTFEKLPVVNFQASGVLEGLLSTLTGTQTFEAIAAPSTFQGQLRPYQERGVGWLALLEQWGLGACLADDMGLGKTIQLIAFLLHLQEGDRLKGPTLLVCPTSVLGNWARELRRFGPSLRVAIHHGANRAQGKAFSKAVQGKDLVITSYALIHRDQKSFQSLEWYGIVLDEAQNIKNPEAKQSQAARELRSHLRIALTGTPLENRLTELWSILDFLNPGYLGARNFFQRRFATPIERYGDTASLETLRGLVQPFMLRRTKTDRTIIQDLPEKQEMTVFCGLTPEQAALYEKTVQESLASAEAAQGIQRRGIILATLVKLKQICNHPAQFFHQDSLASPKPRSGKLLRLLEMVEELVEEGDRALIFTQFAEFGTLLQAYLAKNLEREILFLSGSTSQPQREAMIARFQNDPQGPRLFILSLKAGGVGLNLTRANHVFHFDRWWNPAVENQATDRVFRIGQTRNVQVHKFVCTGTLEEKIHEQLESKKALAEQVVGTGENWLAELDTDQLRQLLVLDRTAVIEDE